MQKTGTIVENKFSFIFVPLQQWHNYVIQRPQKCSYNVKSCSKISNLYAFMGSLLK